MVAVPSTCPHLNNFYDAAFYYQEQADASTPAHLPRPPRTPPLADLHTLFTYLHHLSLSTRRLRCLHPNCTRYSGRLHACIGCMYVGCMSHGHILQHSRDSRHWCAVEVERGGLFCFHCSDYVYHREITKLQDKAKQEAINKKRRREEATLPPHDQQLLRQYALPHAPNDTMLGLRGIHNLGNTCLPEHDTRVLTDAGFLFLSEIEEREAAGQRVQYACYDTKTSSIVYDDGELVKVAPPTRWVDFTHAGTRRLWDATSDDYGSTVPASGVYANYLTLRTTPDHDMYVQPCTRYGEDGHESYEPRVDEGVPIPPHKMTAQELAPGYVCNCAATGRPCTHGYSHYRMYTGAANGLHTPPDNLISLTNRGDPRSPVVALGLRSEDELAAFLELFGYWLGDGWMSHGYRHSRSGHDAVGFEPHKARDRDYVRGLLARLHLFRDRHFTSEENDLRLRVRIIEPRWFRFFDDEFGVKYSNSRHYNKRLALLKQGMHSSQRRPPPASTVVVSASASAAASVTVASSTSALSVSASASVGLVATSSSCARVEAIDLTADDDVRLDSCGAVIRPPSTTDRSSSFSLDLTSSRSYSVSFSFTPRGRSISAASTESLAIAAAGCSLIEPTSDRSDDNDDIAMDDGPECVLCGSHDDLSEGWGGLHCADSFADITKAAAEDPLPSSMPPLEEDPDAAMEETGWAVDEPMKDEDDTGDDDSNDEKEDEDKDDTVKSTKWLPDWVLFRLDRKQLRRVIEGLRQADGRSAASTAQLQSASAGGNAMEGVHEICTSGVGFRDQLIQACLHAGYSAYFKVNTRAGVVRGYNAVPKEHCIYTEEEVKAALLVDSTRRFKPVHGNHDNWWVCYSETVSAMMPAQDVRFDGSACRIRQKKAYKKGWVAVHDVNGTVQQAPTMRELGDLLACSKESINQAHERRCRIGGGWRILAAAEHEEERSEQVIQQAAAVATQPGDLYDQQRDGRVWCVKVQHRDRLIFVQRVHRNANGVVTKVGRAVVTGNCYLSVILQHFVHNPLLRNFFLSDMHNKARCGNRTAQSTTGRNDVCLACDMDDVFAAFYGGDHTPYGPQSILTSVWRHADRLSGYKQQDAHELYMSMLDGLHHYTEQGAGTRTAGQTGPGGVPVMCPCIIHTVYGGLLRSDVQCGTCQTVSTTHEPMFDISLDLSSVVRSLPSTPTAGTSPAATSLVECLRRFTTAEKLWQHDQFLCRTCNAYSEATKQLSLHTLPMLLCVHFKRFEQNISAKQSNKIDTLISFPLTALDLAPYLHSALPTPLSPSIKAQQSAAAVADERRRAGVGAGGAVYDLLSVVVHKGTLETGHYLCYLKCGGQWYRNDDKLVVKVSDAEVSSCQAYLLFYIRQQC